jgi:hypothetical protein
VVCKQGNPTAAQTSMLARRVARELKATGWQLERVLADNGNEFRGERFNATIERLGAKITHIKPAARRRTATSKRCTRRSSRSAGGPAFARYLHPRYSSLKRELERYLAYYDFDRVHHGRLTRGRIPADIVYGANKMKATR